ncbi:MAG: putative signaling protein [Hydrocarboniphaga sp.]|nr:putative signaling protein [Hydrocarboniphaga sp.]
MFAYLFAQNQRDQFAVQEQYRRFETVIGAEQAMALFRHRGGQLNSARLLHQPEEQKRAEETYQSALDALRSRLAEVGQFDPRSRDVVLATVNEVPGLSLIAIEAISAGKQEAAAPVIEAMQQHLDTIETTLESARHREFARAQQIQNEGRVRSDLARKLGIGITVSIMISGLLLVWTIMRSILRPLRITTEAIRQVNAGELAIDLPPISQDEFGEMAQSIRHFRDRSETLSRLAYYDTLTGLGNRAKLGECLTSKLAASANRGVALLFLDLDNFRSVNQRMGHSVGDRYLCEAVNRLHRFIPDDASLFRYNGDKFVVLFELETSSNAEAEIKEVANRVLRGVAEPYPIPNDVLNMSTSIGMAMSPDDGTTAEQLITSAEAAVSAAKKSGRNTARFAGGKLAGQLRAQKGLANEIRSALKDNQFEVFYQPIVDYSSRQVAGAEALLRWRHRERGLLTAAQFIPIAEEEGLIGPLSQHCLDVAHRQAETWRTAGHAWRIAVNLSAYQIQEGRILDTLTALQRGRDPANNPMDLELTETVLFDTSDEARALLDAIRLLGYRIGMDDFGTGYSSFKYLQYLPIDKIKIDRQFVSTMEVSKQAMGIISATIALAQNLDLDVIAEGIETPSQARLLLKLGCRLHQGFHYSQALPAEAFELWATSYALQASGAAVS